MITVPVGGSLITNLSAPGLESTTGTILWAKILWHITRSRILDSTQAYSKLDPDIPTWENSPPIAANPYGTKSARAFRVA